MLIIWKVRATLLQAEETDFYYYYKLKRERFYCTSWRNRFYFYKLKETDSYYACWRATFSIITSWRDRFLLLQVEEADLLLQAILIDYLLFDIKKFIITSCGHNRLFIGLNRMFISEWALLLSFQVKSYIRRSNSSASTSKKLLSQIRYYYYSYYNCYYRIIAITRYYYYYYYNCYYRYYYILVICLLSKGMSLIL